MALNACELENTQTSPVVVSKSTYTSSDSPSFYSDEEVQTREVSVQTQYDTELSELKEDNAKLHSELQEARQKILSLTVVSSAATSFEIEKYKDSDKDTEFYTGFSSYKMLLLCSNLVEESAKHMSYGNHDRMNFE